MIVVPIFFKGTLPEAYSHILLPYSTPTLAGKLSGDSIRGWRYPSIRIVLLSIRESSTTKKGQ